MAAIRYFTPRNLALFSLFSVGGTIGLMKARAFHLNSRQRIDGDYSVLVARAGGGI